MLTRYLLILCICTTCVVSNSFSMLWKGRKHAKDGDDYSEKMNFTYKQGRLVKGGSLKEPVVYNKELDIWLPKSINQDAMEMPSSLVKDYLIQLQKYAKGAIRRKSAPNRNSRNSLHQEPEFVDFFNWDFHLNYSDPRIQINTKGWSHVRKPKEHYPLIATIDFYSMFFAGLANITSAFSKEKFDDFQLLDMFTDNAELPILGRTSVLICNQTISNIQLMNVPSSLGELDNTFSDKYHIWTPPTVNADAEKFVPYEEDYLFLWGDDFYDQSLSVIFSKEERYMLNQLHSKIPQRSAANTYGSDVVPGIRFNIADGNLHVALWLKNLDYTGTLCVKQHGGLKIDHCMSIVVNASQIAAYSRVSWQANVYGGLTPVLAVPTLIKLEAFDISVKRKSSKLSWVVNLVVRALHSKIRHLIQNAIQPIIDNVTVNLLFHVMPRYISIPIDIFGTNKTIGLIARDSPVIENGKISVNMSYIPDIAKIDSIKSHMVKIDSARTSFSEILNYIF